jgi:hypothetical protein
LNNSSNARLNFVLALHLNTVQNNPALAAQTVLAPNQRADARCQQQRCAAAIRNTGWGWTAGHNFLHRQPQGEQGKEHNRFFHNLFGLLIIE